MNDLEYAAKACGAVRENEGWSFWWNPRTDDGDSRRLAVKLRIDVKWGDNENYYVTTKTWRYGKGWFDAKKSFNPAIEGDDLRACREAVFQVAVQIGKEMK